MKSFTGSGVDSDQYDSYENDKKMLYTMMAYMLKQQPASSFDAKLDQLLKLHEEKITNVLMKAVDIRTELSTQQRDEQMKHSVRMKEASAELEELTRKINKSDTIDKSELETSIMSEKQKILRVQKEIADAEAQLARKQKEIDLMNKKVAAAEKEIEHDRMVYDGKKKQLITEQAALRRKNQENKRKVEALEKDLGVISEREAICDKVHVALKESHSSILKYIK